MDVEIQRAAVALNEGDGARLSAIATAKTRTANDGARQGPGDNA